MISDGKGRHPNSCVIYTWFPHFALRDLFHCLREREEILQRDLKREREERYRVRLQARLEEVQRTLIWMATNVCSEAMAAFAAAHSRDQRKKESKNQVALFDLSMFDAAREQEDFDLEAVEDEQL